jgi:hypothetical protein
VARHRCSDYWREHRPEWYELKGRLYRFFGKHPAWERWRSAEIRGWVCGLEKWHDRALAEGSRVAALIERPRLISSRALPRVELFQHLDSTGWDRLLHGIFTYLDGPVRLDDLVSIAGSIFGVKGVRELALEEFSSNGRTELAWDPPAPRANPLDRMVVREQIGRLWSELKSMPRRWVVPFLLNPPSLKSGQRTGERGEIDVFTANGFTTQSEIASLLGFSEAYWKLLWSALGIGAKLESIEGSAARLAMIWRFLPLEDELIARLMELESPQKVINLRMVAKNHLAKVLVNFQKSAPVH